MCFTSLNKTRGGFTLVEILLAVAILGILSGVVAATFHTAVTAWKTGTAAADTIHHADAVLEQLVMALRSAFYPESATPLDRYGFLHKDGGRDMPASLDVFSWVKLGKALVGEAPYAGVPHRVELSVQGEDGPQGAGLYVRSWRLDGQPEDFDPQEIEPVLLDRTILALDCRMMDPDTQPTFASEPIVWIDEWEQTNRIPEKVRIAIAVASTATREEPLTMERFVAIPMAKLSWNPTTTGSSGASSAASRRGRRTSGDRRTRAATDRSRGRP